MLRNGASPISLVLNRARIQRLDWRLIRPIALLPLIVLTCVDDK